MSLTYRQSTLEDAHALVLRQEDAEEVALWGVDPLEALQESIRDSSHLCLTALDREGRVVAILGVSSAPSLLHPWLLSSELVEQHPIEAVRMARRVAGYLKDYDQLVCNWVSKAAHKNRAFIVAAGYAILPTPGSPFDLFYLPKT